MVATASVSVRDNTGMLHTCRVLLNACSQARFVNRLALKKFPNCIPLYGISTVRAEVKYSSTVQILSMITNYSATIDCAVLTKISGNIPSVRTEPYLTSSTVQTDQQAFLIRTDDSLEHQFQSFQELKELHHSPRNATGRFIMAEMGFQRILKNPSLRTQYINFLEEYESLDHTKVVDGSKDEVKSVYYLPQHPVIKESSTITKTTVVFDASA
ncbi:hypothetical protein PR048_008398 [Dryococelus australis]|uniref:Uncharacterized protein n=1 Tax=Dryococelus australis TaxID=614101 RepID=A0ABQ9HX00_9NEOP|nr:hypothetical protein PR048_008398 [Dryococelus australis]